MTESVTLGRGIGSVQNWGEYKAPAHEYVRYIIYWFGPGKAVASGVCLLNSSPTVQY